MRRVLHGGPLDGREFDVPDGVSAVAIPVSGDRRTRSLADLQPEIRFDPETLRITAPPELVFDPVTVRYVWDGAVFRWVEDE